MQVEVKEEMPTMKMKALKYREANENNVSKDSTAIEWREKEETKATVMSAKAVEREETKEAEVSKHNTAMEEKEQEEIREETSSLKAKKKEKKNQPAKKV